MEFIEQIFEYIKYFIYTMCGISVFYWLLSTSLKQKKEDIVNNLKQNQQIMKDFKSELDKRDISLKNSDRKNENS